MANQPCPTALICDCAPTPFRNFSSEAPDPADFFAFAYFFNDPPLNAPVVDYTVPIGIGGCYSVVSQNDANDCALRVAQNDAWDPWRQPQGGHVQEFGNTEQTCSFPCPGGAPDFMFTIAAGTVIAHSQAEADELAASLCRYRGQLVIDCSNPVVPPTIEVVELGTLWDLAPNAGNLVGQTLAGEAGWFNNGGVTVLTFAGGEALATNDFGDVAGDFNSGVNVDGFWYDGILRDLGPGTIGNTVMYGLSDDGFSVFLDQAAASTSSLYNPILFTLTNLGFFGGGTVTVPGGDAAFVPIPKRKVINSSHQITGTMKDVISDSYAFRWSGVLVDITPLAGFPTPFAFGLCIDDTGAVMGSYLNNPLGTVFRTFLNLSGGGVNSNDIGGIGNRYVTGYSMSNKNRFICGICDAGTGNDQAFLWDSVNGFRTIPIVAGGTGKNAAYDCNSHGDAVGFTSNFVAWINRNGITYKLKDILTAWSLDPLWTSFRSANLTNDNRQIAGFGIHGGINKAYLFTIPDGAELGPPPP